MRKAKRPFPAQAGFDRLTLAAPDVGLQCSVGLACPSTLISIQIESNRMKACWTTHML